MTRIDELDDEPRLKIGAACDQIGILPVTLRMWERRYGLVRPQRTSGNYRLYSERDIAILRWLKSRVDSGRSISTAAEDLERIRRDGIWPDAPPALKARRPSRAEASTFIDRLFHCLTAHDENRAGRVIGEASSRFDLTSICLEILTPVLVEIGEAWHRGAIRIATEHFASSFIRGHLLSLFQSFPVARGGRRVLVGCAPGERHEIGSLMLALLLRREGSRVEYLGPDVELDDLIAYLGAETADWLCLSAATEATALALERVEPRLARLSRRPRFGFGGRAFLEAPSLRARVPGSFLGETADAGARAIIHPPSARTA
jgi:DNA-binding transcriptional MerR regulator